jgi:hypothetical protein
MIQSLEIPFIMNDIAQYLTRRYDIQIAVFWSQINKKYSVKVGVKLFNLSTVWGYQLITNNITIFITFLLILWPETFRICDVGKKILGNQSLKSDRLPVMAAGPHSFFSLPQIGNAQQTKFQCNSRCKVWLWSTISSSNCSMFFMTFYY